MEYVVVDYMGSLVDSDCCLPEAQKALSGQGGQAFFKHE